MDDWERSLEGQVDEHRQSLRDVELALQDSPEDGELLELKSELQTLIDEAEGVLLDMKRKRLLASVELMENGEVSIAQRGEGTAEEASTSGDESEIFDAESGEGGSSGEIDGPRAMYMESLYRDARQAVIDAAANGQQTETKLFASWESHGRGVASRLMAKMGYVHGKGLGRSKQGIVDAIVPKSTKGGNRTGLGLNSDEGVSLKMQKRKRGGRLQKARKKRKAAEEAAKEDVHSVEVATGDQGLFQVLNKATGDNSEAAKILRYTTSETSVREPSEGATNSSQGSNRKSIVHHQDEVSKCKKVVKDLTKMVERNKGNKALCERLSVALRHAQAGLKAAEGQSDKIAAEVNRKEELRKWAKF
ncbi:hypothetical protein BSKO_07062 [Bryopsis sp. KO-2023]|nr:hypothetical protein BSKO_07062 [Bryopsis sp. KO-2023]